MKTFFKTFLSLIITIVITSCSKEDIPEPITPLQTSFRISVKDNNGSPVSGASVRLFLTLNDLDKEINQVYSTQYTDLKGETTFNSVNPIKYYFRAEKGCQSSIVNANTTQTALVAFSLNTVSTTVASSGKLSFSNISSNPYDVYINNVLLITNMPGGTIDSGVLPIGNYTIKVVQKSGYILNPTIKTYTGSLLCGGNLLTVFP